MELGIIDRLVHSTVRIECENDKGEKSSGTGFFFGFLKNGDQCIPAIITNKHVIAGAVKGKFHMTLRDENGFPKVGEHLGITFDNFESQCIKHPDPNIDLAIFLAGPLLNQAKEMGSDFFYVILDESIIPTTAIRTSLTSMEDIVMIGYPNGIWDEKNNLPLIRKGITSTHPNIEFNGAPEFLIDAACFPGSSGSPVFLANIGSYTDKKGNTIIGTRVGLLGVLYAGPQHTAQGNIVIQPVPTSQRAIALSSIPNNLGIVIQSSKIKDFEPIIRNITGQ
ncbi:trypsin-like peptidase domain-containing protein [Pseudomonas sp. PDM15]|uniref:S1 family peptidase n=1 Tax=Pseudomonas sp. PDM15 TaxID=2769303 RepID=UPI00177D32F5|nr:serine protease [Pseudomonas sp. PDM15]MBD9424996.1 trypsin-like peptidase domain-containing protein [Pseudomonas sp. PDM15]